MATREDKNLLELFQKTNIKESLEIHKYFDRISKEDNINEYNKTEVNERETGKQNKVVQFKKGGIEVVNKIDSTVRMKAY